MSKTTRKKNCTVNNDVADEEDKRAPQGSRSKLATQDIARELALHRRRRITARLAELRSQTPAIAGKTLLSALKSDRERV